MRETIGVTSVAQDHGRDFIGELSNAVRDNPLPAALIGMGILWMFTGGGRTSVGEAMAGRGTRSMARSIVRGAGKAGESMLQGAGRIGSSVAEAAHDAADAVTGAASQAGNALMPSPRSQSTYTRSSVDYSGSDWQDPEEFSDYSSYSERSSQTELQQQLSSFFEQRPFMLGAVGLALGAGVAASMPVSNAEQKVLGKASDYLQNKVSEVSGQVKDIAAAVVDEADAQGINTQAIRSGLAGNSGS